MASRAASTKIKTVGIVSGGHFLSHFYILSLPPLFPLLQHEFLLSNTQLGLIMSIVSLMTLLQLPVGGLVDRFGAKWILIAGTLLTGLGITLIGFADSYLLILGFALLSGVGQTAFHPADYALINAVVEEDREGKSFSIHTFSGYAGFAAAPLIVGSIAFAIGWRPALIATGLVGVGYAILGALVLEPVYLTRIVRQQPPHKSHHRLWDTARVIVRPGILAIFAFFVLLTIGNKGFQTFTAILATESFSISEAAGNTGLTAYFLLASIGILIGGVLADRHHPPYVIGAALTLAGATTMAMLTTLGAASPAGFVAVLATIGLFVGLVTPSRDRLVSIATDSTSTGKSFGFVFTGITVGGMVGPTLLGAVIDASTARHAFFIVAAAFVSGAVLAVAQFSSTRAE